MVPLFTIGTSWDFLGRIVGGLEGGKTALKVDLESAVRLRSNIMAGNNVRHDTMFIVIRFNTNLKTKIQNLYRGKKSNTIPISKYLVVPDFFKLVAMFLGELEIFFYKVKDQFSFDSVLKYQQLDHQAALRQ